MAKYKVDYSKFFAWARHRMEIRMKCIHYKGHFCYGQLSNPQCLECFEEENGGTRD